MPEKHLIIGRGSAKVGEQSARVGVHSTYFEDLKKRFENV